jgi:hypothetical protein
MGEFIMRILCTAAALVGALLVSTPSSATFGHYCPKGSKYCGGGNPPSPTPTPVPEPSDFALFAGGVAALLIGRRASKGSKRD